MNEQDMDGKADKRGAVHRSPSYPAIDLKTAIERARTFYQHEKRSAANVRVASQHWGYSYASSGGKLTIAALIAYGLMEDKGSGDQRQIKLTDLAFRILLDERPDSVERDVALKRAALLPKIYAELFGRWPDELPSTANLRHYLLVEKKFNENAVDDFIRKLRATADFANIYSPSAAAGVGTQQEEDVPLALETGGKSDHGGTAPPPVIATASLPQPRVSLSSGVREDTFSLDEGQVVLQWPANLSEASFEDVKDWLELQLRKIRRSVQSPS